MTGMMEGTCELMVALSTATFSNCCAHSNATDEQQRGLQRLAEHNCWRAAPDSLVWGSFRRRHVG